MNKIATWIVNHTKLVIIIAIALLIPSVIGFMLTQNNYDMLSYIPSGTPSIVGEKILDETFHTASSSMVLLKDMNSKDVVKVKEKIADVDGVSNVIWIDDIADISIPKDMYPDDIKDIFYSKDGDYTLILVRYEGKSASDKTLNAVKQIRLIMQDKSFTSSLGSFKDYSKQFYLSGLSAVTADTKTVTDKQAPFYVAIAVLLAVISMSLTMDSWALPFVTLAALACAVMYNMGTNIIFGEISYVTKSIAAILQLGVTVDYSIILMDRFNEELAKTDDRKRAMARSISRTFTALLGGSLTTIFGFAALCFMTLTLGLDIGLVMIKGVIFGVLTVVLVLPAFVLTFYNQIYKYRHKRIIPKFNKLTDFVVDHKKIIASVFFVLFIPAIILSNNVSIYYNLSQSVPQNDNENFASIVSLNTLKDEFGMSSTHFILLNDNVTSGQTSQLVQEVKQLDGIKSVLSVNSFVGAGVSDSILPDNIRTLTEQGGYKMIMITSEYASATDQVNEQIHKIQSIVKRYDDSSYVTGESVMYQDLATFAKQDLKTTTFISILAIFILIAIVFKSPVIAVLLVASIELAININEGISTILGTQLSFIAPTVIGCVQLGATVDYAILMTSRFKEEIRRYNGDRIKAMKVAANAASCSVFQSALIFFSATIGVYFICDIDLVKGICSLLARGAVISAFIIIFFLPALLCLFEGIINKTSLDWRKDRPKVIARSKRHLEKLENRGRKTLDNNKKRKSRKLGVTKMRIKKNAIKAVSLTLCLALVFSFAGCGSSKKDESTKTDDTTVSTKTYTTAASSVTKTETVYANLNSDGSAKKVSVTDWIHTNDGKVYVNDKTDLENVVNVKNDVAPIYGATKNDVQWHMPTTDLYYSGTTNKQLPAGISIKYYLDDQEVTPESIAGKSGKIKVVVKMTNNYYKTVKVNGKSTKVYLPMLIVGGFILPETTYSDVTVSNGKAIGDGTNEIALLYGVPGMSESLGISNSDISKIANGITISDTATVTASTSDFELGNMYFAAIPIASLDLDLTATGSVSDLKTNLAALKSLLSAMDGMDISTLLKTISNQSGNISDLTGMINDAVTLYNDNEKLINVMSTYMTDENLKALQSLVNDLDDSDISQAMTLLSNPILQAFITDLPKISNDFQDVAPTLEAMSKALKDPEVQESIDNLPETIKSLNKLKKQLENNQGLIDQLTGLLNEKNIGSLNQISGILDTYGSSLDLSKYGVVINDTDALISKLDAWVDLGDNYGLFTECTDKMNTNLMFIFQTPSISKSSVEADKAAKEATTSATPWYKKIFSKD